MVAGLILCRFHDLQFYQQFVAQILRRPPYQGAIKIWLVVLGSHLLSFLPPPLHIGPCNAFTVLV